MLFGICQKTLFSDFILTSFPLSKSIILHLYSLRIGNNDAYFFGTNLVNIGNFININIFKMIRIN